ncbi:hypothetical protein ZWY2020_015034 [Hordeum vulgare]|nr:hypothetical protein ZWY2020_015034 [Hordeum vulgare]
MASAAHPRMDEVASDIIAAAARRRGCGASQAERWFCFGTACGSTSRFAMERFRHVAAAVFFVAGSMPKSQAHGRHHTEETQYGSVKKVYVAAKAGYSSTEEMQRWMVALSFLAQKVERDCWS